jgi:hypothetical protein
MWGQLWGQMLWGVGPAVPAVGFWTAVALGAVLLAVGRRMVERGGHRRTIGVTALLLALVLPVSAALATVPFSFTNGTVADATQVNSNFSALDSRVTTLEAKSNAAIGVQRARFQYNLASPPQTMTLPLAPGSYAITAAGCGTPTGGNFAITATLRINSVLTDTAILNSTSPDCFTLINAITLGAAGSVAVVFGNNGGLPLPVQADIAWARIVAIPVDSASIALVTN